MFRRKLIPAGAVMGVVTLGLVLGLGPRGTPPDARACGPSYRTTRDPRPNITKIKGRWEVKLTYLHQYFSFRGGNYQLNRLHVFSKDPKFAKWLHKNGSKAATWKAVRLSANRFTCLDLLRGKRLVKLERAIARDIAKHYRSQTKRRAPKVDVMISLATYYNRTCRDPSKKSSTP